MTALVARLKVERMSSSEEISSVFISVDLLTQVFSVALLGVIHPLSVLALSFFPVQ